MFVRALGSKGEEQAHGCTPPYAANFFMFFSPLVTRHLSCPVAFLVFFPRPARTRIVAPHFSPRANGLRRFRLRRPRLILQIFLLALLPSFNFARHVGQVLWLRCAPL